MDALDLLKYASSIAVAAILVFSALWATRGQFRGERGLCARCGEARPTGRIGRMAMCESCGLLTQSRHLAAYSFLLGLAVLVAGGLVVAMALDFQGFVGLGWRAVRIVGFGFVAPVVLLLWIRSNTRFERWRSRTEGRSE